MKKGLLLFALRNGNLYDDRYTKHYAEKYLIVEEGQVTPFHFHWKKMEDIINRGGGNLLVQVYNDDGNGGFADTPVKIMSDGHCFTVPAGEILRLTPGRASLFTAACTTPSGAKKAAERYCSARYRRSMTTIPIIDFMKNRGVFRKLRRTRRRLSCSVMSIPKQDRQNAGDKEAAAGRDNTTLSARGFCIARKILCYHGWMTKK